MENLLVVNMTADTLFIESHDNVNLALWTINSLFVLAPFRDVVCNKVSGPQYVHTILEFSIIDHRRCLI